jgi:hypothetical protein
MKKVRPCGEKIARLREKTPTPTLENGHHPSLTDMSNWIFPDSMAKKTQSFGFIALNNFLGSMGLNMKIRHH